MADIPVDDIASVLGKYSIEADAKNLAAEFVRVAQLEENVKLHEDTIYIECFAVQTPRQGQKLGSKLMRKLFEICSKKERDILLYTNTDRNKSIYEHFGYECILKDHVKEINIDTYFMLKRNGNKNK